MTQSGSTNRNPAEPVKILIFTDSRGQHKPRGCNHDVFAERMAKDPRFEVDSYLCPMKWTTTVDFLMSFSPERLERYDHIILYTGIVEWSPRKISNAVEDLYDRKDTANLGSLELNTRDYSRKVVNSKKAKFDEIFGPEVMARHFATPFETAYDGERTINMYPLEAGVEHLASRLVEIPNLIFINANRIVAGWKGDYPRERPANMSIIHDYSARFAACFPPNRVVDLLAWSDDQVKEFTCDNLHLTQAGSDWIYDRLMEKIQMSPKDKSALCQIDWPETSFHPFSPIERMTPAKIAALTERVSLSGRPLATLVIGVRMTENAPERVENLKFLLEWIDYHYGKLFDVLLVEQDVVPRLDLTAIKAKDYVRHEFIFNDKDYNRGWGYNVAVRHFCKDAAVVALMDTDVLTGSGFISAIMACHQKVDVCSPYVNVYYTDADEAAGIRKSMNLAGLTRETHIKNPVTICGGIVIFRRSAFLAIKGFEQYIGYSCEDRALDVTILNHFDRSRILVQPETYVHLHHPADAEARTNFNQIYAHLQSNYGCRYHREVKPFEFIHRLCDHVSQKRTMDLILERAHSFGDLDLYRSGQELTSNGQINRRPAVVTRGTDTAIFPVNFDKLSEYSAREIYTGTEPPDSAELAAFYNRYKGERCFIIGNGPSLNRHDLSLLEGEFTFGVNSFYYKTRETGFMPTFYVVEDSSVMRENLEEIRAFDAPFKFFPTIYRRFHPKAPNVFFFEMNRGFYEKSSPNYVVPRFSTDASKVLYCGQSVTYINLQLAFFMGFTEVYLIGMDFDYVIPDSHARTGDVLLSDSDDPNHFHKDYFGAGKTWKDPKLDRVALNYRQAKLSFEAVGRRIYNATIGGKLEIFDRVDYETLLRDPAIGRKHITAPQTLPVLSQAPAGNADAGGMPSVDLAALAAQLLLDPASARTRLQDEAAAVSRALAALPEDSPVRQHFQRVRAFAEAG